MSSLEPQSSTSDEPVLIHEARARAQRLEERLRSLADDMTSKPDAAGSIEANADGQAAMKRAIAAAHRMVEALDAAAHQLRASRGQGG